MSINRMQVCEQCRKNKTTGCYYLGSRGGLDRICIGCRKDNRKNGVTNEPKKKAGRTREEREHRSANLRRDNHITKMQTQVDAMSLYIINGVPDSKVSMARAHRTKKFWEGELSSAKSVPVL